MEKFQQFLLASDDDEDEEAGIPKHKEPISPKNVRKGWDKAELLPPDGETQAFEDEACYLIILKTFKILAYIVTFILTLGGAVVGKSAFLFMTSQLQPERRTPFCGGSNQKNLKLEAHQMPLEMISWTWAIFFCFAFPELLVFLRALRIWLFKATFRPTFFQFFIPLFFETCHSLGLALLAFVVLPSMNVVRGAMLSNAVCLIPTVFSLLSRTPEKNPTNASDDGRSKWLLLSCVDGLCVLFLVTGFTLWPIFNDEPGGKSWLLPVSCILVSCGWWENYADRNSYFKPIRMLGHLNLGLSRYTTYLFMPFWKIAVFGSGMVLSFWIIGEDYRKLFTDFERAFQKHTIDFTEIRAPINGSLPEVGGNQFYGHTSTVNNWTTAVQYAMLMQILGALLTYLTGKFSCKIGIQSFSFAFPLNLSVPMTLVTLVSLCGFRDTCFKDTAFLKNFFPPYIFFECAQGNLLHDFIINEYGWVWFLWVLAQIWVTIHIWTPKFRRLEKGEVLFVLPMYSGLLVDQSLTLNRRRQEVPHYSIADDEGEEDEMDEIGGEAHKGFTGKEGIIHEEDSIPKIYACATMWHEIKSEMKEMLKSIFRMDEDQAARRIARKYFFVIDPDYYDIETHIFFDDAFNKAGTIVNSYVKDFIDCLEDAASQVHETIVHLAPPKKFPTPYGGRLEWTLPGGTKLYVHLKNKNEIRHKKRWSQVMYMYYLLGHRLLERDIPVHRKEVIAENTFILALDGDIDFKPQAVRLLVDLMKKSKILGAACGRIHPIGSGLMVWYQKFEYAIGHWFQKATEHVIGCVLCSPGCFSLFRAKALLDKNVMAKYTTMATEPRHFVQYDQGEDRWLCTLLLQQGYRVEYSAASDALTHCPEQFGEFFTQRRRWVPSTMANIIDLLVDYKRTIRTNPDISSPYIAYQMLLMVGSILGPGSIFLMLIGAFNTAFGVSNFDSFLYNVAPVAIFIIVCFFASSDVQLIVAQILAAFYALVMVAVLVALLMQIQDDGLLAPTSLFLFMVAFSFVTAAILHPLEFGCLPFGIVYYITIPSMYLLLIIYSLMNLNVVSWGTREVVEEVVATPDQVAAAAQLAKVEDKNMFSSLLGFFQSKSKQESEGSFEISFAGLFKLMCCTKPVDDDKFQLTQIASSLVDINKRLDGMERPTGSVIGEHRRFPGGNPGSVTIRITDHPETIGEESEDLIDSASLEAEPIKIKPEKRNFLVNPEWIDDPDLQNGEVDFLAGVELTFWRDMIDKYLLPLDKDEKKEKQIADGLIALRNKTIFFFFMVNAVFVVAIFLLQNQKETIYVEWPLGATFNMTYNIANKNNVDLQRTPLRLEPIGVVFVAVFAVILSIQFLAMLVHRFGTFCHILASTVIEWCTKDVDAVAKDTALEKEGLSLIRKLQKLKNKEGDVKGKKSRATIGDVARRKTIANLEKSHDDDQKPANIESAFKATFKEISQSGEKQEKLLRGGRASRVTFQQMARRRSTVLERKASTVVGIRKSMSGAAGGGSDGSNISGIPYHRPRHGGRGSTFTNPVYDPEEP